MKFQNVNEILDFAIEKEQDAHDFYMKLADKMQEQQLRQIFLGFATEEMGHKQKLIAAKDGKLMIKSEKKILDLKIGDNLEEVELDADLDYQDALIVAMKAEKTAFKLYSDLADATDNPGMKDMLLSLALEEAKHKLRFEIEYDDHVLTEN